MRIRDEFRHSSPCKFMHVTAYYAAAEAACYTYRTGARPYERSHARCCRGTLENAPSRHFGAAHDVQLATMWVMPQPANISLVSLPTVVIMKFLHSFVSLALCHSLHSSLRTGPGLLK